MIDYRRWFVSVFCLALFLFDSPVTAADQSPKIDGAAVERGLKQAYKLLKDKRVDAVGLEEMLEEGDLPLAERYKEAKIRLHTDLMVDSVMTRPEINLSVFIEEEDRLSAELWKIYFEKDEEQWTPKRYKALIRAHVGDRFRPRKDEVFAFDSLTIRRDSAEFHITDGVLIPGYAGGEIGRVVLFGQGSFSFKTTNRVERQQLNKYAKNKTAEYITEFTQMVLLVSPEGYANLIDGVDLRPEKRARSFKRAEVLLKRVDKDYMMEVKPSKKDWSFAPSHPDYLRAEFDRAGTTQWLVYAYNPFELEEISLTQKSGFPRNFNLKSPVLWCHFPGTQIQRADSLTGEEPSSAALLNIQSYIIQGILEDNKEHLRLKTIINVTAMEDSVSTLTFMLNPDFDIRRVTYQGGEGALLIKQGSFISIPLLNPLRKDQRTKLTFWYEGDIIRKLSDSFFTPLRNEQWLPQHSNRDAFLFDMEMRVPKSMMPITTGIKTLDYEEGDTRVTRWQALRPITLLGLTFSQHRTVTAQTGEVDVTIYMDKDMPKSSSREEEIVELIDETLPFYSKSFGDYPYKKLDIVQMPDNYEYGQGLPTVLMLWGLYFRSDYLLDRDLSVNKYFNVQQFFRGFLAHELAHQWWGNVVIPKTYRDAWLSEGMATYAADLFIENMVGKEQFYEMLKTHARQARKADKAGAIILGRRLKEFYQPVVYDKGAMVLHMLRQIAGDENFYKILSVFYQNSHRRMVTTADFRRVAEDVMAQDMDWFFDQWLRDTGYPVYRSTYTSVKRTDNQFSIQCTISQEQDGRIFKAMIPIHIELKDGTIVEKVIWNTTKYHTFEVIVSGEIKEIVVAPGSSVYCEITS
jgi:hypothetical protein